MSTQYAKPFSQINDGSQITPVPETSISMGISSQFPGFFSSFLCTFRSYFASTLFFHFFFFRLSTTPDRPHSSVSTFLVPIRSSTTDQHPKIPRPTSYTMARKVSSVFRRKIDPSSMLDPAYLSELRPSWYSDD